MSSASAPPFHMTDFESGHGQYAAWKDDIERREAFRSKALHVIRRWTNKPFSAGVVIPDLRRVFAEYDMPADIPSEPYPLGRLLATPGVLEAARWAGDSLLPYLNRHARGDWGVWMTRTGERMIARCWRVRAS
jgi:hypothetical protein